MGELRYLGAIIPIVICEYAVCICLYVWMKKYNRLESGFFDGKNLANTARCHFVEKNTFGNFVLLIFRVLAFAWLGIVGSAVKFTVFPGGWQYYTNWNLLLIAVYFLLASVCSVIYLAGFQDHAKYIAYFDWLGKITGSSYGFVASSALMVTVLDFIFLNPTPDFWNVTQHLTQTLCMLVETALNSVVISPQEVLLALSWPLLWAIFIWSVVATGVRGWPYFFVRTASPSCFVWYNVLFLMSALFFFFYYGVNRLKFWIIGHPSHPALYHSLLGAELGIEKEKTASLKIDDNFVTQI